MFTVHVVIIPKYNLILKKNIYILCISIKTNYSSLSPFFILILNFEFSIIIIISYNVPSYMKEFDFAINKLDWT